ncbi:preprotein translocase subunit YajC [Bacteroidetes bacterium endosymbiont of Geopemphigus sp.]|uniref:preprotein translocase subunit YajC n=1 Tax=Bacteroidetes bacterium endosymbiont of Geopemphigus sp. TaxID=2047937 RepID=UPI000CD27637|nr:preprotein translocase subunit YajC [Bacteroidetes bacterium endosymbiont of Geopemphigus sp.]
MILLQTQQNPLGSTLWMFALMFVVFYFFMIRPQMRRQKSEKKFQADLKKGDRVVTNGGIHGKILEITDESCVIETLAGKIKFERSAISREISHLRYSKEVVTTKKEAKDTTSNT